MGEIMDNPNYGCTCSSTLGPQGCPVHTMGYASYPPPKPHPNREPALAAFRAWLASQWNLAPDEREIEDPVRVAAKFDELFPDVQ